MNIKSVIKKTGSVAAETTTRIVHYGVDVPVDATVTAAHGVKDFFGEKGSTKRAAKVAALRAQRLQEKEVREALKLKAAEEEAKLQQARTQNVQTAQ